MSHAPVPRPALPAGALARSAPLFDPAKDLALEHARQLASRREFMEMKLGFIRIAAQVQGVLGTRLQWRVRQARRTADLLALQPVLAEALPAGANRAGRLFSPLVGSLVTQA